MKPRTLFITGSVMVVIFLLAGMYYSGSKQQPLQMHIKTVTQTPSPTPTVTFPVSYIIPQQTHVFQTFNNCGPAALSMTLSYVGIYRTQQELGRALRPYQNPSGDNDDKSVILSELAQKAPEYGLIAYHRPAGSISYLKRFISNDIPVVARTWLRSGEDIGHYRVVRGYDGVTGQLIQDDSLQGAGLRFSYDEFLALWEGFNYEYLVFVPPEKRHIAERILGEDLNERKVWQKALEIAQQNLRQDPDNIFAAFNVSVAYYHLGEYRNAVDAFEKVQDRLPFRMLWYQIEPILAYQRLGDYERVFVVIDRILSNHNRAFSELYQIRGEIYLTQGDKEAARREFEQAVFYNQNYQKAHGMLEKM